MSLGNIKYFAVLRSSDKIYVADYLAVNKAMMPDFTRVIEQTMDSPNATRARLLVNYKGMFTCFFIRFSDCHYFLMTSPTYTKQYAWDCLARISQSFSVQFRDRIPSTPPHGLTKASRDLFAMATNNFDDPAKVDTVARIQRLTNETMDLMGQNIDKLIQNNAGVETMDTKAADLADDANSFKLTGKQVKKQAAANNRRSLYIILGIVGGVVLVIVVVCLIVFL